MSLTKEQLEFMRRKGMVPLQDALASIAQPEGTEIFLSSDCNISNNPKAAVIRELSDE